MHKNRTRKTRSCPSSVRVNTRGLPGDHHKGKDAGMRGLSWHLSALSPLVTPSTPAVRTHVAGSGPLPWLLPTTSVGLHPCCLGPWRDAKEQHLTQRPDMVGEPRRHGGRTGPPLLRGAAAVGALELRQGQAYARVGQAEIVIAVEHG